MWSTKVQLKKQTNSPVLCYLPIEKYVNIWLTTTLEFLLFPLDSPTFKTSQNDIYGD